jgi:hypothetical protein
LAGVTRSTYQPRTPKSNGSLTVLGTQLTRIDAAGRITPERGDDLLAWL